MDLQGAEVVVVKPSAQSVIPTCQIFIFCEVYLDVDFSPRMKYKNLKLRVKFMRGSIMTTPMRHPVF